MINTLDDYVWRSLPEWGDFVTNPNLQKKVDQNGQFLPFYGNTTVFLLDGKTKQTLHQLQEELYSAAGWMLAQKLDPGTFHMTLHDLVNSPEVGGALMRRMSEAESGAKALLGQWCGQPPLHMQTTWLFNMVNTSIVLGLKPADEDSWHWLDEMYTALEAVVPLGYSLTPHITMAYYRSGSYSQQELDILRNALHPVELTVELSMENLALQNFRNMNTYMPSDMPIV